MRHQLLTEDHQALRQHSTVSLSYVGRAAMGAAERYVREIQTEATSLHAILVEVSAAGGSFCISFMQWHTLIVVSVPSTRESLLFYAEKQNFTS